MTNKLTFKINKNTEQNNTSYPSTTAADSTLFGEIDTIVGRSETASLRSLIVDSTLEISGSSVSSFGGLFPINKTD